MKLRVLKSDGGDFDRDFIEQIIELDKANMQAVLDIAGLEFPEQNRRDGFKKNPTFIVAENEGEIAGYLEYTRSRTDADLIYLSSIQIEKKYRRSDLLLKLIDEFVRTVGQEDFRGFEANVRKNNFPVIKLYRKIGFEFKENPRNSASWRLTADHEILNESPVNVLLEKWREKHRKS